MTLTFDQLAVLLNKKSKEQRVYASKSNKKRSTNKQVKKKNYINV